MYRGLISPDDPAVHRYRAMPPWMAALHGKLGEHEIAGRADNPWIVEVLSLSGLSGAHDETAWCGAAQNWSFHTVGIAGPVRPYHARNWLGWGVPLERPVLGCVTIFSRPPDPTQGHVAQYILEPDARYHQVLGGNQHNEVCEALYESGRVLGYRWPPGVPLLEGLPR